MRIEFLLLACSYKNGGRCVAGIDVANKRLIRLVSRDDSPEVRGAIKKEDCCVGGKEVELLDVVETELAEKAPADGAQTENYFVDTGFFKRVVRKAVPEEIYHYFANSSLGCLPFGDTAPYLEKPDYLKKGYSLCLVKAYAVNGYIGKNNKQQVRFSIYAPDKTEIKDYSNTNPVFKAGHFEGKAFLLISLPPYSSDSYIYCKFVSGIIPLSDSKQKSTTKAKKSAWSSSDFSKLNDAETDDLPF